MSNHVPSDTPGMSLGTSRGTSPKTSPGCPPLRVEQSRFNPRWGWTEALRSRAERFARPTEKEANT